MATTVVIPTWRAGTLYYTGTMYDVRSTTYWNRWETTKYTVSGTTRAMYVNAPGESYTITLTCRSGYIFSNGLSTCTLYWNINTRYIDVPTWTGGTLRYTGSPYTVDNDSYWSWWDSKLLDYSSAGTSETDVPDPEMGLYEIHLFPVYHEVSGEMILDTAWNDGYGDYGERTVTWEIYPMLITLPAWTGSSTYTYDGASHGPPASNVNTTYCAVSGDTTALTNAGNYLYDVELIDALNTNWSDNTVVTKSLTWTINPATLTTAPTAKYIEYTGSAIDVSLNLTTYWNNWISDYGLVMGDLKVRTNAGTYLVRLQCNSNYQFSSSISAHSSYYDTTWTISPKSITPPSWKANVTYNGSLYNVASTTYWNNWNTSQCTISGTTTATNAGTYEVSFDCTSNYTFNGAPEARRAWTINRSATVSIPEWNGSILYKGSAYDVSNPSDGYWLNWNNTTYCTISGSTTGTNAGAYSVTFTCKSNYAFTNSATTVSATWLILRKVISPPTWIAELTYSGSAYSADDASYWSGWNSSLATISAGSGGTLTATNAGTYSVLFRCTDNYTYSGSVSATRNWTISKYSVTLPTWTRTGTTETYDTYNWALSITNPAVTRDTTRTQIDPSSSGTSPLDQCGTYYVKIDLINTTNYQWSNGTITQKLLMWRIEPLYIAAPTWKSGMLTYSGESQSAVFNNYWNWAYNVTDTAKFTRSSTWSATNAGNYTARISIASAHHNSVYFNPNDDYVDCTWTIDKYSGWGFSGVDLTGRTATGWVSFTALTALQPSTITISTTSTHIELSSSSGYKVRRIGSWDGHSYNSYVNCTTTDTNFTTNGADCYVSSAIWDDATASWTVSPTTLALKMHGSDATKTSTITKGTETFLTYSIVNGSSATITATLSGSTITVTSKAVGSTTISVITEEYNSTSTYRYRPQKTINISVTVSNNVVDAPSWKGDITYNGTEYNVASSTYWNNWNTTYFNYIAAELKGTNAGIYTTTFECKAGYEFSNGTTASRAWIIKKVQIIKPSWTSGSSYTYNWGASLGAPAITYNPDKSTLSGDTGSLTDVGTYTITCSLDNTTNYEWTDGTTSAISLNWYITQLILTKPTAQSGSLTYNNTAQSPSWNVPIDSHVSISGNSQTNAGSYTATFTIDTSLYGTNAVWSGGTSTTTCAWSIGAKTWGVVDNDAMLAYATPRILIADLFDDAVYASDVSDFDVTRTGGDNCVNISEARIIRTGSYTGTSKTAILTISPKSTNTNYTGSHTVNVTVAIWLQGTWSLTPDSYNTTPSTASTVTITGYNSSLTYTITPGNLTITRSNGTLTVTTPATANTYTASVATAEYNSSDYTHYPVITRELTVVSKSIVVSPTWKNNTPTWTGNPIDVASSTYWNNWNNNLDYSGTTATDVGIHTATFSSTIYWLDTIGTTSVSKGWRIAKIQVRKPSWTSSSSYTYDWGAFIGPPSMDYDDTNSTRSGYIARKNIGTYTVTCALKDNVHCEWTDGTTSDKDLTWYIVQLVLARPESLSGTLTYNGSALSPSWDETIDSHVIVTGNSQTNAGTYTATFTIDTTTYGTNVVWNNGASSVTCNWSIHAKSWSTRNNSDMTAYGTSSISLGALLNGVYESDVSTFSAIRSGGDDCVTINDTTISRTGSYSGTSKSARLTIGPNSSNYVNELQTASVTIAIWRDGTWSLTPSSYNSAPSTSSTVTITGYNSSLTYTITPGSLTVTRSNGTLTVTTPSTANTYTANIATLEYNLTSNYTHYPVISRDLTVISKSVLTAPTWKGDYPQWTGSSISVAGASHWDNWNTSLTTSGLTGTNVGTYTATFSSTTYWLDTIGTTSVSRDWLIIRAYVNVPYWTDSAPHKIYNWGGTRTVNESEYWYDNTKCTKSGTASASAVGSYHIDFTITDTAHYQWATSGPSIRMLIWYIDVLVLTSPTRLTNSLTYNSASQSPTWDVAIDSDTNHIVPNNTVKTNAGTYTATYTIHTNYLGSVKWDNDTYVASCNWTISKASWSVTDISLVAYTDNGWKDFGFNEVLHPAINTLTISTTSTHIDVDNNGTTICAKRKGSWEDRTTPYTSTVTIATSDGNFTASITATVTSAIWKAITDAWSLNPSTINAVPSSNYTSTITDYNTTLVYTITPGGLTITRTNATLSITTPAATGKYTATISTPVTETANYIHYAAVSEDLIVFSYTIISSPTWKNNNPQWTGSDITVDGSTYWNNWPASPHFDVIGSTTTATDIGSHTAHFRAKTGYWLDTAGTFIVEKTWYIVAKQIALPYWTSGTPTSYVYNWGASYNAPVGDITFDTTYSQYSTVSPQSIVGSYDIPFYLTDTTHTTWTDGTTTNKSLTWSITTLYITPPTTITTPLTFNNTTQTPTWDHTPPSSTYITYGGDQSAKYGGTYTATFTIKSTYYDNAQWTGVQSATVSVQWAIDKLEITHPSTSQATLTYNASAQLPTWSESAAVTAYTSNNKHTETNVGSYTTTWTITNEFSTSVYWDDVSGLAYTISWSIVGKSDWGVINNSAMTAYSINQIEFANVLTGVATADMSSFTFTYSSGTDCVTSDSTNETLTNKISTWTETAVSGVYTVASTSPNYTGTKNVTITLATWKDVTWSLSTTSVSVEISSNKTVTILSYSTDIKNALTFTPSATPPFTNSFNDTTGVITINGVSYGSGTLGVSSTVVDNSTRHIRYPAHSSTITISVYKHSQNWNISDIALRQGESTSFNLSTSVGALSVAFSQAGVASATVVGTEITINAIGSTGSRTQYTVTAAGNATYNSLSRTANIVVDLTKYVRIFYNNAWHRAVPYVFCSTNNEASRWHKAEAYVYNNNSWRQTSY